nr:hypothetical protein [Tanacetum cinerariifolium]
MPLRKPIAIESNPPKPVVTLVYSRKPKESRNNVPRSKSKINKYLFAKNKEPNKSWGSTVSNVPSSSIDECRNTTSVQNSNSNVNSDLQCVTCNGCLFSDNHDSCVLEFINNVNARVKSKSVKETVKRKIWKPTEKVFTNIGYIWRPNALKNNLRKLKGKVVVDEAVILHPMDPELLTVDVAPLAPKLRNNRTAHSDYLKHTQEETATLRGIVKHERSLNPLNTSLDYA